MVRPRKLDDVRVVIASGADDSGTLRRLSQRLETSQIIQTIDDLSYDVLGYGERVNPCSLCISWDEHRGSSDPHLKLCISRSAFSPEWTAAPGIAKSGSHQLRYLAGADKNDISAHLR